MDIPGEASAIEEYDSLRQELYTIISARYNILTANIALVATVIGVALSVSQPAINLWLPVIFSSILLPSLIMNLF